MFGVSPNSIGWSSQSLFNLFARPRDVHVEDLRGYDVSNSAGAQQAASNTSNSTPPAYACGCASCHGSSSDQPENSIVRSAPGAGLFGSATVGVTSYNMGRVGLSTVDGILSGAKWSTTELTYSFPTSASQYQYEGEKSSGFGAFDVFQQAGIKSVLAQYSAVTNLAFTQVTGDAASQATLRFAESSRHSTAYAYYPSGAAEGGDVWVNGSTGWYNRPVAGNYAYLTFLHEIGHALGLKHAHEGSVYGALPTSLNAMPSTVMSYLSYAGAPNTGNYTNAWSSYAQTLMSSDILALQEMYGANYSTNSTDTIYKWLPTSGQTYVNGVSAGAVAGNVIFETIWDGGGFDTYDFSAYSTNQSIDLRPGAWSRAANAQLANLSGDGLVFAPGNVANAYLFRGNQSSLIEAAVAGSGNDVVYGNDADNKLYGNNGNDSLNGGIGKDYLDGGAGRDSLLGGAGDDTYHFDAEDLKKLLGQDNTDWISDTGGVDRISFGAGIVRSNVSVSIAGTDLTIVVTDSRGASVFDKIVVQGWTTAIGNKIEKIDYADGTSVVISDWLIRNGGAPEAPTGSGAVGILKAGPRVSVAAVNLTGTGQTESIEGNNGINTILGGAGDDRIYGFGDNDRIEGQLGNDHLFGGTGVDRFIFRDVDAATLGIDRIYDFTSTDQIVIDIRNVLRTTPITASQFAFGAVATDASDRVLYDRSSGIVRYDADGTGSKASVILAILDTKPLVTYADFDFI